MSRTRFEAIRAILRTEEEESIEREEFLKKVIKYLLDGLDEIASIDPDGGHSGLTKAKKMAEDFKDHAQEIL